MVFCPSCAQQQEDVASFCRFCGEHLPGAEAMRKLRDEARRVRLAVAPNGASARQEQETLDAIAAVNNIQHSNAAPVNAAARNGIHRQQKAQNSNNLRNLMEMMDD
jgi:hypothetical protein